MRYCIAEFCIQTTLTLEALRCFLPTRSPEGEGGGVDPPHDLWFYLLEFNVFGIYGKVSISSPKMCHKNMILYCFGKNMWGPLPPLRGGHMQCTKISKEVRSRFYCFIICIYITVIYHKNLVALPPLEKKLWPKNPIFTPLGLTSARGENFHGPAIRPKNFFLPPKYAYRVMLQPSNISKQLKKR